MIAQNKRTINLTYSPDDFSYTKHNGTVCISSTKHDYFFEIDTLKPALPVMSISFLIGPDEEYESFTTTRKESLVEENVIMNANPLPTPTNEAASPIFKKTNFHGIYPTDFVEFLGTYYVDKYQIASFKVSPFIYNADNQDLYLNTSLKIVLSTKQRIYNNVKEKHEHSLTHEVSIYNMVQELVVNAHEIDVLYGKVYKTRELKPYAPNEYDYLIITKNTLKPAFQPLAEWKTRKGIRTKILTIEEIQDRPDYDSSNPQLSIKKAIKEHYDHRLMYLLLGGDTNIIPSQNYYIEISSSSGLKTALMPTDLFYSSFGKMDWGTGTYNEVKNFNPNIISMRIPVRTAADAEGFVQRIISYEKGERRDSWTNKILMGGARLNQKNDTTGYFSNNGVLISDAQYYGERIYTTAIEPYWNCNRFRFFDTGTDSTLNELYDFTANNIGDELSKGYLFADITTHGSPWSWTTERTSPNSTPLPFMYTNASNIANVGNTIIVTTACLTNAFDSITTCLSEAFMRNVNGGILGYLGCSRQGWYYSGLIDLGSSAKFDTIFYKKLFNSQEKQFGKAVWETKITWCKKYKTTLQYATNSEEKWLLFGINPLGDPEMPLFTEHPLSFNNKTVSYADSILTVNAGVDGCRICVMSRDDNGGSYYGVAEDVQSSDFNIPFNNIYSVCITKPGYIPYLATVYNGNYIQNEEIDGDTYAYSNQLSIGSDVTTMMLNGPVTIKGGKTTINVSGATIIKNDFKVQNGAELLIETGN